MCTVCAQVLNAGVGAVDNGTNNTVRFYKQLIPNGTEKGNIQLYHTNRIDDDHKGFSHVLLGPLDRW